MKGFYSPEEQGTWGMKYTKADIIDALCAEWDYLCHEDFDPETDTTTEEYCNILQDYTLEQLIEETGCDEHFTLDEFMDIHGNVLY